jgi:hypothetical protein
MSKVLSFILISLFLIGCAEDHPSRDTSQLAPADRNQPELDLIGKSTEEVLKIKYKKAVVVCSFWFQYGSEFLRSNEANVVVTYDLKKPGVSQDGTLPETRTLFAHKERLKLAFSFEAVQIHDLHLSNSDGFQIDMIFSPHLDINFEWQTWANRDGEGPVGTSGSGKVQVIEKISTTVFNGSDKSGDDLNSYFQHSECYIDTDIRPKYKNQFSKQQN